MASRSVLELAASQVGAFSIGEILERVEASLDALQSRARDLPERHRSLRAAIDGSVQDLGEDVRRFFGQLSVFRGGWSREAAEALDPLARERLETLRNRSFAQCHRGRFRPALEHAGASARLRERPSLAGGTDSGGTALHGEFFAAYVPRSATKVDALERERDKRPRRHQPGPCGSLPRSRFSWPTTCASSSIFAAHSPRAATWRAPL